MIIISPFSALILTCLFICFPFFFLLFCRLDVYIYDYLMKRKLHATAKAFVAEGKVATDPVGEIADYFLQC